MEGLFEFLAGPSGRAARGAAGAALILGGLLGIKGVAGTIVAIVGLVPVAAGVFDFCLLGPLARMPLQGKELRAALQANKEPESAGH
jgi:hypothetical protein